LVPCNLQEAEDSVFKHSKLVSVIFLGISTGKDFNFRLWEGCFLVLITFLQPHTNILMVHIVCMVSAASNIPFNRNQLMDQLAA
jgi:hypothetical protein